MSCSISNCYAHLDTYDSKKPNSILRLSARTLIASFNIPRASKLDTEYIDRPIELQNPKLYNPTKPKRRRNIWTRLDGLKTTPKDAQMVKIVDNVENENLAVDDSVDDYVYGVEVESSVGRCNVVLEKLESDGGRDDEAMKLFEWMRVNGKLVRNVSGYKLALRVLGRRQDWDGAEKLIHEMESESGCEVGFHVFNTLIYACCKRGNVGVGKKWFKMMLERGVEPNVATFGMVMSLYQKGGGADVGDAEFAFSEMRRFGVVCNSAYSAMITMYTRIGLYEKAEEVIGFLREDKVVLNRENWLVLLNAYSQSGKLDEAEKVLVSMHEAGFAPHIVAYNTLITGYGKASNMKDAERIFQNLVSAGLEPDESTYRTMVEGWGRVHELNKAEWYYKEMNRLGFKPNSSNLFTMINLQAKHGDEEGAVRTINDMMKIGCQLSSILSIVSQAYEKAERFEKVPFVVKGLLYNHVLNNQTSCSILVMAYVKHSLVDDAIKVLRIKKWKDKVFEDSLYHLLICTCKELGRLDNSIKIYTSMPKRDKPNLHITCTMIDIYSCLNQFSEAESLYIKLKSKDIALDLIAFSIVVRMYVKSGSLNDACSVLEVMEKQKDIVPDIYLFRDMLRIYQRLGMVNKLADLYYKILKAGLSWDQEMYNCVINCCARALPVDELSRLFNDMVKHGFSPNTITFNVMLDVYGKSGLFKKVRQVFWMAKKQGCVDVVSYNTIVAAYGKGKDLRNMASVAKRMKLNGFSVSLEAYNCMLDAYGKAGEMEKFKNVLLRMKESNCRSDHYTFNIMINMYGEKGWIEEVGDVLMELKESGMKPDLCGYNSLIKAYGIAGMVEDAVDLVREMRQNGIEPDRLTYTNLISALQKNDMILEALKWSLWMKQMGI
ncbi:tetratricopeptide repeat (TPR)-like superfamily protein [Artemisia annua]|uniref:Tetratricopeptide repeat (TPR)-like superfamily protein n=1 Tax=Artemisia annua TaxID=35608 RepID=A0A2U1PY14_ARTAN|nr:tetratricopeptide repeat (TPR)-like superfamily protein [Artemisia annua]